MSKIVATALLLGLLSASAGAQASTIPEGQWVDLMPAGSLFKYWQQPLGDWVGASETHPKLGDETLLERTPGDAVAVNGPTGRTEHLRTNFEHGDIEAHLEFMVPKGSNSGVYFMGRYEIQVLDSWGVEHPKYGDCGGIYQRWNDAKGLSEEKRGYEGCAPRVNASLKPGEWQTFDVVFQAPRFDEQGNKIADAKFVKVVHNGQVIHENVTVSGPTRAADREYEPETATGCLKLQGDHGPVAYRNIRIRSTKGLLTLSAK